jgi:hypothetical protein
LSDEPKEGKQGVAKKTADEGPYCLIRAKLGKQAISTMVANKVCSSIVLIFLGLIARALLKVAEKTRALFHFDNCPVANYVAFCWSAPVNGELTRVGSCTRTLENSKQHSLQS